MSRKKYFNGKNDTSKMYKRRYLGGALLTANASRVAYHLCEAFNCSEKIGDGDLFCEKHGEMLDAYTVGALVHHSDEGVPFKQQSKEFRRWVHKAKEELANKEKY